MPPRLSTGANGTPLTQAAAPNMVSSSEPPASTGQLDGWGTK